MASHASELGEASVEGSFAEHSVNAMARQRVRPSGMSFHGESFTLQSGRRSCRRALASLTPTGTSNPQGMERLAMSEAFRMKESASM
jgi:hypothetical protein